MLSRTIRASRLSLRARPQVRCFSVSSLRQADLVQDMYLSELRKYKPTPIKPSDAEGHVQKFAAPRAPSSPEESSIANQLQEYEGQSVEVEGQAAAGQAEVEQDWFEEPVEEEEHQGH